MDPAVCPSWRSEAVLLHSGLSTRPRRIWTPGTYGSRVHQIAISSTDAGANVVTLWVMQRVTQQANMGTGAFVDGGGGSDTITRSSGSFVTDGWEIGDLIWVDRPTTLSNGFVAQLTNVASGTLTFATGTVGAAENLPSGSAIFRAVRIGTSSIAASAASGNVAGGNVLNSTRIPALFSGADCHLMISSSQVLALSAGTALATAETLGVVTNGGDWGS